MRVSHFSCIAFIVLIRYAEANESSQFWDELKVGGFSSAGITLHWDAEAEAAVNELSLLVTSNSHNRISFFSEFEIERPLAWNDNERYGRKESKLDLERLYFDYNITDKLNFRIGRFLTPSSRWNLLRAPPLVWTSSRPLATSRLFPIATNGITLHGALPINDSAFEYNFFTELSEDQQQDHYELQYEHVRGARFSIQSNSNISLSLLSFSERDNFNGSSAASYRMLGLDFATKFYDTEISGEVFQRVTSKGKEGGNGAYIQTAVPIKGNWYLITRLESLNRPNEGTFGRWVIGTTLRVNPAQMLKLEFTGGSGNQPDSPRGFIASYALFF